MDNRSPLFSATSALFRVASQTEGDERKYGRQNTTTFALSKIRNFFTRSVACSMSTVRSFSQTSYCSLLLFSHVTLTPSYDYNALPKAKVLSTFCTTNFFSRVSWRHRCFTGWKTMKKSSLWSFIYFDFFSSSFGYCFKWNFEETTTKSWVMRYEKANESTKGKEF